MTNTPTSVPNFVIVFFCYREKDKTWNNRYNPSPTDHKLQTIQISNEMVIEQYNKKQRQNSHPKKEVATIIIHPKQ